MQLMKRGAGRQGFTLVEVLVAMMLGLGLAATAMWFTRVQFHSMEDQAKQLRLQGDSRAIIEIFAREVRRAGMDPTCAKVFDAVAESDALQVRFQADLNSNGALDAGNEDLHYRIVDDVRFERVAGGAPEVLLDGVDLSGSRFRYFDAAGSELPTASALTAAQRATVRRVRLELAVSQTAAGPDRTLPLRARAATDVALRNRFFINANGCP